MTAKEALEILFTSYYYDGNYHDFIEAREKLGQSLDRLEKLEKELKQTKSNFRNSQTHSKNCYKKLKEKYNKRVKENENNKGLVRENVELINKILKLQIDKKKLDLLEKAIKIFLKKPYVIEYFYDFIWNEEEQRYVYNEECTSFDCDGNIIKEKFIFYLTKQEYELLKEVFGK